MVWLEKTFKTTTEHLFQFFPICRNLRDIEVALMCKLNNDTQPVMSHCIIWKVQLQEQETLLKSSGKSLIKFSVARISRYSLLVNYYPAVVIIYEIFCVTLCNLHIKHMMIYVTEIRANRISIKLEKSRTCWSCQTPQSDVYACANLRGNVCQNNRSKYGNDRLWKLIRAYFSKLHSKSCYYLY